MIASPFKAPRDPPLGKLLYFYRRFELESVMFQQQTRQFAPGVRTRLRAAAMVREGKSHPNLPFILCMYSLHAARFEKSWRAALSLLESVAIASEACWNQWLSLPSLVFDGTVEGVALMKYSKHGRYLTVEYQAYKLMKKRCYNQRDPHYKYYGGKGIIVCPRWLVGEDGKTGPECFLDDMGRRPPGLTLQRIDRESNYCPQNCCWGPLSRPRKRFVVLNGKTLPLAQVAQTVGLRLQTIVSRLRSGMVLEEAIARPPSPRRTRGASNTRELKRV